MTGPIFGTPISLIDKSLVDEYYPIRSQLTAKYKKGFAYKTVGYRLPVILTKIIDGLSRTKNQIGEKYGQDARSEIKGIVGKLAQLKNELQTNKPIKLVPDAKWNDYLERVAKNLFDGKPDHVCWYLAPWLYVECYLYHRVHLAFSETIHLKNYDYFQSLKEDGFNESVDAAKALGDFTLKTITQDDTISDQILQDLLEITLWGNRSDLSLSCGEQTIKQSHFLDQLHSLKKLILADDSKKFWDRLNNMEQRDRNSIGYILDNAGFELFSDLCFAELLLTKVDRIDFYVKTTPWFVSDVMEHDFHWLLETMSSSDNETFKHLGERWKNNLSTGRWAVVAEPFWTYPQSYFEMKNDDPNLYAKLSSYKVLIFKGDLNYRKLVGDINWEPETPFQEALQGFCPTALLAIRTSKADTIAGLPIGVAENIRSINPEWLLTGEYGVIQFAS